MRERPGVIPGHPDVEIEGDGLGAHCCWDHPCARTPTHYVVWPGRRGAHPRASTFGARHYVLALAEMIEVHTATCAAPPSAHVVDHGPL